MVKNTKLAGALAVPLIMALIALFSFPGVRAAEGENKAFGNQGMEEKQDMTLRYVEYLEQYPKDAFQGEKISIDLFSYKALEGNVTEDEVEGLPAVVTEEQGRVQWDFTIKKAGLYTVLFQYYPLAGYGSEIERSLTIDGILPFREAASLKFTRIYGDEIKNPSGEIVRPNQIETPEWSSAYARDSYGYFGQALYFYLTEGSHTLELLSVKEPVAIGAVTLQSADTKSKDYETVCQEWRSHGAVDGSLENGVLVIQAENAWQKGDPTLYAGSDSTSTQNQPFDYKDKLINVIGGNAWKYSNQWISWKACVPKSGFYHMGARSKQNFVRDIYCNRTLYIDGKIPFQEAENIHFDYSDEWKCSKFGGDTPWLFYLEEGEHTFTLTVTAGDLEGILTEADYILENLNRINLELLAILSINPDVDRDYQIGRYMPGTVEALGENKERLKVIYDQLVERTGKTDSLTSQLEQLISLLDTMWKSPDKIAGLYSRYRDLTGNFGIWIMNVREHPLILDYLFLTEPSVPMKVKEDGFFKKAYSGLVSFAYSFGEDYSMLSENGNGNGAPIVVWIGSGLTGGRDQAMALNQMIQQQFTKETGISAVLQLVPENTILMATLAGRGPDVALQVKMTDPVDFALRNAVYDLSMFPDFQQVKDRFFQSALEPFLYEGGVYALPETMSFPMLFYRTDIMEDLGISPDSLESWEDIKEILPVLQGQNMNFALPATMSSYSMYLYQMGGSYYTEDQKASALDSKEALDAFEFWTDFYSDYSLPVDFSFENRFRTGEMPIGIAEYTTYNLLSISAPEIKGKWVMAPVPGMKTEDGILKRISPAVSQGCILMNASRQKENAWEFMKWWTSQDAQYEFGKQLEAVMGAAARYNTANIEALKMLPWSAEDRQAIMIQAESLKGMLQVPGGYFTERNLNFAKLAVINDKENPRESLAGYSEAITEEIKIKRREFGLDE